MILVRIPGMINSLISKLLFFATLFLFTTSCNQRSGPCDWREIETYAKVTSITPYVEKGDSLYRVTMKFEASVLKEKPQTLNDLKGFHIDKAFLQRNRIQKGLRYKFTVHELLSGNCKAPVIVFHHAME